MLAFAAVASTAAMFDMMKSQEEQMQKETNMRMQVHLACATLLLPPLHQRRARSQPACAPVAQCL